MWEGVWPSQLPFVVVSIRKSLEQHSLLGIYGRSVCMRDVVNSVLCREFLVQA